MKIKNILATLLAMAFAGSIALAQTGQPRQPAPGADGMKPGMGRGGDGRGMRDGRPDGGRMGGRGMGGMRRGMDFDRLNLNDSQKQRIQALMESNRQSAEANRAQFEEMGKLMRLKREGLLTTEQGNRLTSLQAQMTSSREKMHNDILAVLTPEQKTLLEQMKNQPRDGGMRRMRGPGGPGGQGGPGQPGRTPMTPPGAPSPNNQ